MLQPRRLAWHFPKAILFSSDRLSPSIRSLLTKELGISVFSVYGAVEALKIGFECDEQKGYHLILIYIQSEL